MIEPKELRIGNWVNVITKDNPVQIDGIKRQKVKDGYYYSVLIDGEYYLPENLNGIPLTPKILLLLGAEKMGDYYKIFDYYYCLNGDYPYTLFNDMPAACNSIGDLDIKYVHQLQNGIYFLTGKELTLKSVA